MLGADSMPCPDGEERLRHLEVGEMLGWKRHAHGVEDGD